MTAAHGGIFIRSVALTGASKPPARLDFNDGLTVVSGASDTGKSYALSCIDYALGAGTRPRDIQAAHGYTDVMLWMQARGADRVFELTRSLSGGEIRVREFRDGAPVSDEILRARHAANDPQTLSYFLLSLSGFDPDARVRKNAKGTLRSLSFRDVAFLTIVDEERIIAERPPHLSGSPVEKTVESSVFKMMVTGHSAAEVVQLPEPPNIDVQAVEAQLEVLRQMGASAAAELEQIGVPTSEVASQLERMDQARQVALGAYEKVRGELGRREMALADLVRKLREVEARSTVLDGLVQRFQLLDSHYQSDLERLDAIREAGSALGQMPKGRCPMCGALPEAHAPEQADEHYSVQDVEGAVAAERLKITALQGELNETLTELAQERDELATRRSVLEAEARGTQTEIDNDVAPRMAASVRDLNAQVAVRDRLQRAQAIADQLRGIQGRITHLEAVGMAPPSKEKPAKIATAPTAGEMDEFCREVERVLKAWHYPDSGRVVFSEEQQDLVIRGQPRGSHGKGVRALTCAAFITALMQHCVRNKRPHPGFVVLDSPLVVYREPDAPGAAELRRAGVNAAFYGALAAGIVAGQVIVFENEDPPSGLKDGILHHHFSKSAHGRYGFIPVRETGE
jgi:hypothetical protein